VAREFIHIFKDPVAPVSVKSQRREIKLVEVSRMLNIVWVDGPLE
jgi:hypothetical protein